MRFSTRSLTLAFGLLVPTTVRAFTPGPWSTADTLWEVAYASVVAVDCTQSVQITPSGRYERNPFLPKHPSANTFKFVCTASVVGHVAISYCLPVKWRRDWQVITFFAEGASVTSNYFYAGLAIKF